MLVLATAKRDSVCSTSDTKGMCNSWVVMCSFVLSCIK